jgi:hypothetical protein
VYELGVIFVEDLSVNDSVVLDLLGKAALQIMQLQRKENSNANRGDDLDARPRF